MAKIDTSVLPYNNKFDQAKRFSEVLFRPGRPALAQELLEEQSIKNNQLDMLGSTLFAEGAIVSGMQIVPVETNTTSSTGYTNLFSVHTLLASNSTLNTNDYVTNHLVHFSSKSNLPTDYNGFEFTFGVTKGLGALISFKVKKSTGTLTKLSLDFDNKILQLDKWHIDNKQMSNASLNDLYTKSSNVAIDGSSVNLNDGAQHTVTILFRTQASGVATVNAYFNAGYSNLDSPFTLDVIEPLVLEGNTVKPWIINPKDSNTASSTEKVKKYKVTAGRVWLGGLVREFDEQQFSITGVGREQIGLVLDESIVTSEQDSSLKDDTPGAVTYGEAGADRLKYNVKLSYNDPSSTPFAVFVDNVINQNEIRPDYTNITKILAKRTFDQSGSFRTEGFEGHMHKNSDTSKGAQDPLDASKILLDIDKGQAYVRGYSISTDSTTTLRLDIANETAQSNNEGHYYSGSNNQITVINQPVKTIDNVTFSARKTTTYARPSGGTLNDTFTSDNATYIRKVWDNVREYKEGVDFTYINNTIHWGNSLDGKRLPGANVPNQGQSYSVTYDYSVNAVKGVDYLVKTSGKDTYIDFNGATGSNKPTAGTTINITYTYFCARIDMIVITMDQSDPFHIVKGQPAPLSSVMPPILNDPLTLELGYVLIQPNSHDATFTMQTVTRQTFETLQQWGRRLTNAEYSLAIANMNETVKRSEDPMIMKDVFSDSFNTINNRDDEHSTVAYDFEKGEILVPSQASANLTPNLNFDASQIAIKGHLVTPPYHEEVAINQPISTGTINVNEFNIFSANGSLELDPASDNWIDNTKSVVTREKDMGTVEVNKWWWHNGDNAKVKGTNGQADMYWRNAVDQQYQYSNIQGINWINEGKQTGYMLSDGGSTTVESAIQFMRANHINFEAKNLPAFTDGFTITIDGVKVDNPTPQSSTYSGANGSFRTDEEGKILGSFDIPGGVIRTGTRTVKIVNKSNDQATANYTAQGTLKDTQSIIEKRIYTVNIVDPLAQSFTVGENRQLTSVDLYFKSKPKSNAATGAHRPDLIVQIRELSDDGYPNNVIRAETTLTPSQIQISNDASLGTRVTFPDSLTLTANHGYAIVLISDSNDYEVFNAQKGGTVISAGTSATVYNTNPDAISNKDPQATGRNVQITNVTTAKVGDTLTGAPNSNGVQFISNNAQTWSADGTSSLKFAVNVAKFQKKGEVLFDPIVISDWVKSSDTWVFDKGDNLDNKSTTNKNKLSALDRLAALTTYLTYQNTSMHWYIRVLQNLTGTTQQRPEIALESCPWLPLPTNNDNSTYASSNEDGVPIPTLDKNIQTMNGELISFQNTIAMQVKAEFDSDDYVSPVLTVEDLSLVAILTGKKAEYESINMDQSGDAAFNKVKLQFDGYLPNVGTESTKINPMYSVDGGQTWYSFPSTGGVSLTTSKTDNNSSAPTATKDVTQYFTRYTYEAQVPHTPDVNRLATQFKVRLYMTSSTNFQTPRVRKLACMLSYDPELHNN